MNLLLFSQFLILALCNCNCVLNKWTTFPTSGTGPKNVGGHSMTAYKENLYVFGGFNENFTAGVNTFYNYLYELDTCTGHWDIVDYGTGPSPRAFHTAVTDTTNSRLLVFGGITYNGDFSNVTLYSDLWAWDFHLKQWSLLTNGVGPSARAEANSVFLNNKMWVFAGANSPFFTATNDLWSYDVNYNVWRKEKPTSRKTPEKRLSFVMVPNKHQDSFYIFSGETGADTGFSTLNDTYMYDIKENVWTDVTPNYGDNLYEGRSNFLGATIIDQLFVLYGGEGPNGQGGCNAPFPQDPKNETWVYNTRPHDRKWVQIFPENTPPALKRHAASHVGDCMFIFGGWSWKCPGPGQVWNNKVYTLKI